MPRTLLFILAVVILNREDACAHAVDVSQLRIKIAEHQVSLRFTLNVLALDRIVPLDTNKDEQYSPTELDAALPKIAAYLEEKTQVSINDNDTKIGALEKSERVWPRSESTSVAFAEAGQRFVDLHFSIASEPLIEDLWLGFEVFARLGDQHTIQAIYEQTGQPQLPVEFSQFEPEYLYDTGFAHAATKERSPPPISTLPVVQWGLRALALGCAATFLLAFRLRK